MLPVLLANALPKKWGVIGSKRAIFAHNLNVLHEKRKSYPLLMETF